MHARSFVFAALSIPLLAGCGYYDPPPEISIAGEEDGLVPTGSPGLDIVFSEPIDPSSLRIEVVPLVTDAEGDLPDEDQDPSTSLVPYFAHDQAAGDTGGKGSFNHAFTRFRIVPTMPFPVGPKLAVLVEQGLSDSNGNATHARRRLPFAYRFTCTGGKPESILPTGAYFFLFDIDKPIGVQIQILADVRMDPDTGTLLSQFTNADRNPDPNRCPTPCKDTEACRLLPEPKCVIPSEPAGSVDEYSDFVPRPDPPTGFTFTVNGCAEDTAEGTATLATVPTDLVVQKPPVEVTNLAVTCSFQADAKGVLRCTGSNGAEDVKIGGQSAGPAEGTSTGRVIPEEDRPKDLPAPPG